MELKQCPLAYKSTILWNKHLITIVSQLHRNICFSLYLVRNLESGDATYLVILIMLFLHRLAAYNIEKRLEKRISEDEAGPLKAEREKLISTFRLKESRFPDDCLEYVHKTITIKAQISS